ncbi:class I SAM-dependent RNA methyltransferase [Azospirillum sp. SYSU D00513]|uniref:class I SAM-dependent RNA methyltransferase n=1 Tax=Azospirillum sp. SYSU D00513 TaxID=2812561 RepID=UPI001A95A283|nr:class I SAM-dependent RNA methyltransferase [Azospirillum sp. SYSU D00513]
MQTHSRRRPASRSSAPKSASKPAATLTADLTIAEVGARGDGVALHGGTKVFVPLTVPGDRVRVRLGDPSNARGDGVRGELLELLEPGPTRGATAACGHFGACGGCTLQHMTDESYAAWKVGLVRAALARVGLGEVSMEPLSRTPEAARRRARLAAMRRGRRLLLGFNERQSHRLVDVEACPVLVPALAALVAPLRALLAEVLPDGEGCDVVLADLEGGIDLLLVGPRRLDRAARDWLTGFAEVEVARISWQADDRGSPEPIVHRRPVAARFAGVPVTPAPGAFLQASAQGEAALVAAVLKEIEPVVAAKGAKARVADLFAGLGTFSLPLATLCAVHAVEGDAPAMASLAKAASGLRLVTETRDLFENPLTAKELARFDAVVFDPPRAGAAAQAEALAASKVPLVVAVSCNPATFARDARALADGGYRLERVYPVDQFLWSAHVELVGLFRR